MNNNSTIFYAFVLMALLIGVTFFVGLVSDANAFFAGLQKLVFALTGRKSDGSTSSYPSGASL